MPEMPMSLQITQAGLIAKFEKLGLAERPGDADAGVVFHHRIRKCGEKADPEIGPAGAEQVGDDHPSMTNAVHFGKHFQDHRFIEMVQEHVGQHEIE